MEELWGRALHCPHCTQAFDTAERLPLLLTCGHTLCGVCCTQFAAVCPIDGHKDIRELTDISVSHQHMRAVLQVEPGCYWHLHLPALYYCAENFVSVCESCRQEHLDWDWSPLTDVDLPTLFLLGIEKLCEDSDFKAQVYEYNSDLKDRMRNRRQATAREKQTLYFHLLSYRDQQDSRVPDEPHWPYAFCWENAAGEWEIKRFSRILPNKYTEEFEKVQLWRVDQPNQVEAVSFTVSIATQLCGVWLCQECCPRVTTLIASIRLLPGLQTSCREGWQLAQNVAYSPHSQDSMQEIRLSQPLPLSANSPYTLKVKYKGTGVYYGDPGSRTEVVRGPQGLVVRFLSTEYTDGELQNGEGRRSGPIVGFSLRPDP